MPPSRQTKQALAEEIAFLEARILQLEQIMDLQESRIATLKHAEAIRETKLYSYAKALHQTFDIFGIDGAEREKLSVATYYDFSERPH